MGGKIGTNYTKQQKVITLTIVFFLFFQNNNKIKNKQQPLSFHTKRKKKHAVSTRIFYLFKNNNYETCQVSPTKLEKRIIIKKKRNLFVANFFSFSSHLASRGRCELRARVSPLQRNLATTIPECPPRHGITVVHGIWPRYCVKLHPRRLYQS